MAGVEADTSSYPRPSLPVSPLDIASKLGGLQQQSQQIQQGAVNLDKSKLDLYNKHFEIMNNELSTLANDPATTKEEVLTRMHRIGDGFNMPKGVRDQMEAEFADVPSKVPLGKDGSTNPVLGRRLELIMRRGMDMSQRINQQIGPKVFQETGQGLKGLQVPGSPSLPISETGDFIQKRITPTQGVVSPEGQPQLFGEQGDVPMQRSGPRLPIAPALPSGPMDPSAIPGLPPGTRAIAAQVMPATTPTGPATGLAPGESEAAAASGQHLAQERLKASAFQRDVFPLAQAIPALEALGTKGTGPGTETINQLKSFALSNIPGVKESDFNGTVADYDKAKKYLTDFVNQTGSGGTNDKLAAAFAGNPSVKISNAAAVDVAKSALALRRMQQAIYSQLEKENTPASKFSRELAKRSNNIDPRAFGVDMMNADKLKKLYEQVDKNPIESKRFDDSLNLAHTLGFITPPSK